VQKFSSKNAMEKERSGAANTCPAVELSGNNMVLLMVPFVKACFQFSIFLKII
jgi:hypothetical protein